MLSEPASAIKTVGDTSSCSIRRRAGKSRSDYSDSDAALRCAPWRSRACLYRSPKGSSKGSAGGPETTSPQSSHLRIPKIESTETSDYTDDSERASQRSRTIDPRNQNMHKRLSVLGTKALHPTSHYTSAREFFILLFPLRPSISLFSVPTHKTHGILAVRTPEDREI